MFAIYQLISQNYGWVLSKWRELEAEFLTLASQLQDDSKWQKLIQDLDLAEMD